jgi:hypothetical protein
VIQHKGETASGLVAIIPACPENTTEDGKNGDRKGTNCEHEMESLKSARFMPLSQPGVNPNRAGMRPFFAGLSAKETCRF